MLLSANILSKMVTKHAQTAENFSGISKHIQ